MAPPIVFDGLRLLLNDLACTPRGIDRVDLGYARFLFETWPEACYGLLPTPWGVRLFERGRVLHLLGSIETLWRENRMSGPDPVFETLMDWLLDGHAANRTSDGVSKPRRGPLSLVLRCLKNNGLAWGGSAVRDAPHGAIYLNVGQLGWASPFTTGWLRFRPDVRAIFMLHDLIPMQYPHLVSKGGRLSQDWMLRSVIKHADGLITTTQAATDAVTTTLTRQGVPDLPLLTAHLPVDEIFLKPVLPETELRRHAYFAICGAIEPRKNHLLLLEVWRLLVKRLGRAAPRLVIIGSPAHEGHRIQRMFRDTTMLRDHVILLSGMASPSMRRVMANARAVLMPSLAEGFGLPVAEALAMGTPVLASDLPAHREVGGKLATYLDPGDPTTWFDAIMDLAESETDIAPLVRRVAAYRPQLRCDYFRQVTDFLAAFPPADVSRLKHRDTQPVHHVT